MTRLPASTCLALALLGLSHVASAQSPPEPRFIAASIQRSPDLSNPQTYRSGGFLRGDRYDLRKVTMLDMVRLAYGVEAERIVGGPDWLEFDRFDIAAKAPPQTKATQVAPMLRALLADRFHLVAHEGTRPLPAFALTQTSASYKMKPAGADATPDCHYQPQPERLSLNVYSCRNIGMEDFARRLKAIAGDYLQDQVIDSTGLSGSWDFDLSWNYRTPVLPAGTERVTIFAAVAQQLGLELKASTASTPVVVIESVSERPTPDAPNTAALLPPREIRFEVASVKRSGPDQGGGGLGVTRGGGFEANETMERLFATAFDIHWDHIDELVLGMPKWMESERYAISAKPVADATGSAPQGTSFIDDEARLMLRNLLIERFNIKTHFENRQVNAYTLVAAKPKLTKAAPGNRASCAEARRTDNDPRDRNQRLSRLLECKNLTTAQLASQLLPLSPNDFVYPVVDATGLTGRWDILLNYTSTYSLLHPPLLGLASPDAPPEPDGAISIFSAMSRQLGLKLESRKRTMPVLVLDHIDEIPNEN